MRRNSTTSASIVAMFLLVTHQTGGALADCYTPVPPWMLGSDCRETGACLRFNFAPGANVEATQTCALAGAVSIYFGTCADLSCFVARKDAQCRFDGGVSRASASAGGGEHIVGCGFERGYIDQSQTAEATAAYITVSGKRCRSPVHCQNPPPLHLEYPGGATGGWSVAQTRFDTPGLVRGNQIESITFDVAFPPSVVIDPNDPNSIVGQNGFGNVTAIAAVVLVNNSPVSASGTRYSSTSLETNSLVYDPVLDVYSSQQTIDPGNTFPMDITVWQGMFRDADMDLTGDGRFNQFDVDALYLRYGPVDPNFAAPDPNVESISDALQWDLNLDAVVDEHDEAIMQALVDFGFGSGVFADTNGSGTVDCNDVVSDATYLNTTLGDGTYLVVLDRDLDGIIDQTDLDWVQRTILPGDVDADNDVDLTDLAIVSAAFDECVGSTNYNDIADIDQSGCVDLSDLAILFTNFDKSCP